ncbi:hypothetical protein WOLCODRAFT_146490 [Wolfiporia cocos MD-104 SS10]|uniref:Uncharacterized protein n=1 Tax=Wolfiporia cocos (strain MD-104) TaxID=742152 RepID=A0A2H3JAX8_WOLCO|nr:hypothetical protein WOLCODRAFT_146490 [Wolfiporia cocos MD-104 SS10]
MASLLLTAVRFDDQLGGGVEDTIPTSNQLSQLSTTTLYDCCRPGRPVARMLRATTAWLHSRRLEDAFVSRWVAALAVAALNRDYCTGPLSVPSEHTLHTRCLGSPDAAQPEERADDSARYSSGMRFPRVLLTHQLGLLSPGTPEMPSAGGKHHVPQMLENRRRHGAAALSTTAHPDLAEQTGSAGALPATSDFSASSALSSALSANATASSLPTTSNVTASSLLTTANATASSLPTAASLAYLSASHASSLALSASIRALSRAITDHSISLSVAPIADIATSTSTSTSSSTSTFTSTTKPPAATTTSASSSSLTRSSSLKTTTTSASRHSESSISSHTAKMLSSTTRHSATSATSSPLSLHKADESHTPTSLILTAVPPLVVSTTLHIVTVLSTVASSETSRSSSTLFSDFTAGTSTSGSSTTLTNPGASSSVTSHSILYHSPSETPLSQIAQTDAADKKGLIAASVLACLLFLVLLSILVLWLRRKRKQRAFTRRITVTPLSRPTTPLSLTPAPHRRSPTGDLFSARPLAEGAPRLTLTNKYPSRGSNRNESPLWLLSLSMNDGFSTDQLDLPVSSARATSPPSPVSTLNPFMDEPQPPLPVVPIVRDELYVRDGPYARPDSMSESVASQPAGPLRPPSAPPRVRDSYKRRQAVDGGVRIAGGPLMNIAEGTLRSSSESTLPPEYGVYHGSLCAFTDTSTGLMVSGDFSASVAMTVLCGPDRQSPAGEPPATEAIVKKAMEEAEYADISIAGDYTHDGRYLRQHDAYRVLHLRQRDSFSIISTVHSEGVTESDYIPSTVLADGPTQTLGPTSSRGEGVADVSSATTHTSSSFDENNLISMHYRPSTSAFSVWLPFPVPSVTTAPYLGYPFPTIQSTEIASSLATPTNSPSAPPATTSIFTTLASILPPYTPSISPTIQGSLRSSYGPSTSSAQLSYPPSSSTTQGSSSAIEPGANTSLSLPETSALGPASSATTSIIHSMRSWVIGVIILSIVLFLLLPFAFYFWWRRHRRSRAISFGDEGFSKPMQAIADNRPGISPHLQQFSQASNMYPHNKEGWDIHDAPLPAYTPQSSTQTAPILARDDQLWTPTNPYETGGLITQPMALPIASRYSQQLIFSSRDLRASRDSLNSVDKRGKAPILPELDF